MTEDELVKQIEETAKHARTAGMKVEINSSMPWVSVDLANGRAGHYFFQGEEASNLLDGVPDYVNSEDFILWSAQGW